MTTLNEFLQKHPVKPIRLYRPDPKDWFKDVMCYLNRPRDWQRRVNLLRMRAEVLDCVDDPDEDLARYRDEVHGKLSEAEQDMRRVRVEVMELIGQLPDADQQMAMIRRYMGFQSWKEIAWARHYVRDCAEPSRKGAVGVEACAYSKRTDPGHLCP